VPFRKYGYGDQIKENKHGEGWEHWSARKTFWSEDLKESDCLEYLSVGERMILKYMLKK